DPGCTRPSPTRRWSSARRTPRAPRPSRPRRRRASAATTRRRTRTMARLRCRPGARRACATSARRSGFSRRLRLRLVELVADPREPDAAVLDLERQRIEPALRGARARDERAVAIPAAVVARAQEALVRGIPA